jgi:hypothetical protein
MIRCKCTERVFTNQNLAICGVGACGFDGQACRRVQNGPAFGEDRICKYAYEQTQRIKKANYQWQ